MTIDFTEAMKALQKAILENKPHTVLDMLGQKSASLPKRLDTYIQGYRIRLMNAVENDYPTLKHYMGEDSFRKHVAAYVENTESHSYTIDLYPLGFAEHMVDAIDDSMAISLAALEAAISQVFWLKDSSPFVPKTEFSMEDLLKIKLRRRTASMLLELSADAESYLTDYRNNNQPAIQNEPCYLMIVRHENEVKRHRLDAVEYKLLQTMQKMSFAKALEEIGSEHQEVAEQLANWLTKWVVGGFFRQSKT